MSKLEDILDEIKVEKLDLLTHPNDLTENDPHRPYLRIWAGEEDDAAIVTLSLSTLMGQQSRFVSMTPDEARTLARKLITIANAVDEVSAGMAK